MPAPFDKNELGNKAVLDFSSIKKKNFEKASTSEKKPEPVTKENLDKEEMKLRVNTARLHADKEITKYKELVSNFKKEVEQLCLFKNVGEAVEGICIDYILDVVIDPILKGNKPYGMPEELFREIRREMYKDLMNKYVDK